MGRKKLYAVLDCGQLCYDLGRALIFINKSEAKEKCQKHNTIKEIIIVPYKNKKGNTVILM